MKYAILPCRSISLGPTLLFGCILLGLLTALPAAAQDKNVTCVGASMGSYAELGFCLPPQVVVEPESVEEANYTAGREVSASMLLNGSRVSLHLLYPCQAPESSLDPESLKSLIAAYDPVLMQMNYSDSLLSISGLPAIWGQLANQKIIAAYQPTNQTPALIVLDGSMNEETMAEFLQYLQITVKEGSSPLFQGYCPDTTSVSAEVKPADAEPETVNVENNTAVSSSYVTGQTQATETKKALMSAREKMAADREAAIAMMKKAKANIR
jgi:hypothetical protein